MSVNLFQHIDEIETYAQDDIIFRKGDSGEEMYIVIEGEVDILVRDIVFETVRRGGIFGEMALVDDKPRSAGAMARTPCKIAPINEKSFFYLIHKMPSFALDVMRVISDRLRRMNDYA
jgi:CRP/FNR family cyclic AMP-dependent transcriptional regulator